MALGESDVLWGSLGLPKRVFLELRAEVCEAPYDPALEVPEHTTSAPNSIGKSPNYSSILIHHLHPVDKADVWLIISMIITVK